MSHVSSRRPGGHYYLVLGEGYDHKMSMRRKLRLGASALLVFGTLIFGVSTSTMPAGATSRTCETPIAKWIYTPRAGVQNNVYVGQTFDVTLPKQWDASAVSVTFTNHDVIREVCSQLGDASKRVVLFDALSTGTSEVSLSLKGQPTSVRRGQIIVNPILVKTSWPKSFTAHIVRALPGYSKPAKMGMIVKGMDVTGTPSLQRSTISMKGRYGYALATVGGFQYVAKTIDDGGAWRVASTWFAGPWADGAAFAGAIKIFSPSVAAASGDGQVLYTTTDGGKRWYGLFFTGDVVKVMSDGINSFSVDLSTEYGVGKGRTYVSHDGGLRWEVSSATG